MHAHPMHAHPMHAHLRRNNGFRQPAVVFVVSMLALTFSIFAVGAAASDADAVSTTPAQEPAKTVEVYQGPRVLKTQNPRYPAEQRYTNGEGWVVMQYMVDTTGKPYEITVVDSVGSDNFSKSAVAALKNFTFQPAMVYGQPIDAGHHQKVVFALQGGATGAQKSFVRSFRRLSKAIAASDKDKADQLFAKLKITNLYEDAFYNYMRASYYAKWGTPSQQLAAVRRAVAHEDSDKYLEGSDYLRALQWRFALEIELNDFAAATATASLLLERETDPAQLAIVNNAINQLAGLRESSQPYTVSGDLGERTSWWYGLFRNKFQVSITEGRIAELKLRCRKSYVFFRYDPELEYSIPKDHMPCGLEVLGDPGTKFAIAQ